jgi:hypothetical protein
MSSESGMCSSCNGIGKKPGTRWDGAAYVPPGGICEDCSGVGYLGFAETDYQSFFDAISPRDCHPRPVGDYPYTSQFFTPGRRLLGATVGGFNGKNRYFLPARG